MRRLPWREVVAQQVRAGVCVCRGWMWVGVRQTAALVACARLPGPRPAAHPLPHRLPLPPDPVALRRALKVPLDVGVRALPDGPVLVDDTLRVAAGDGVGLSLLLAVLALLNSSGVANVAPPASPTPAPAVDAAGNATAPASAITPARRARWPHQRERARGDREGPPRNAANRVDGSRPRLRPGPLLGNSRVITPSWPEDQDISCAGRSDRRWR
jgi:hypothetical protein